MKLTVPVSEPSVKRSSLPSADLVQEWMTVFSVEEAATMKSKMADLLKHIHQVPVFNLMQAKN
jgi:hypothetical protein